VIKIKSPFQEVLTGDPAGGIPDEFLEYLPVPSENTVDRTDLLIRCSVPFIVITGPAVIAAKLFIRTANDRGLANWTLLHDRSFLD
jgi:hypothetical protein